MIEKLNNEDFHFPQDEIWENNLAKYGDKNNLIFKKNSFLLAKSLTDIPSLDGKDTGLMQVRFALADAEGDFCTKYIALQSYFDNGGLSTIDIVKLPFPNHADIATEYLENILTPEISRQYIPVNDGRSRFLAAGGFIRSFDDQIAFVGGSSDFADKLSTYNVNNIASYLTAQSELFSSIESSSNGGKEYVEKCLDIMAEHKLQTDFYSNLIDLYLLSNIGTDTRTGAHLFYALTTMKSIDRSIKEEKDILQVLTEEMNEGIGRDIFITSVVGRMKEIKDKKLYRKHKNQINNQN